MHLGQPGFTYSASEPFTKHRERIQKFTETGHLTYTCKNELDKACFVYDAAYSDSKYLAKRPISDKVLKDKFYEIAISLKYDGYQRGFLSLVYNFFLWENRIRSDCNKQGERECKWRAIQRITQTGH